MVKKKRQKYFLASGEEVQGATTILGVIAKPALINWANRQGLAGIDTARKVDDLADIGTLAHSMIHAHIQKGAADFSDYTPNQRDRAENAVLSYFAWEQGKTLETKVSEVPLVSEKLRYGGTPDWYGLLDGVPTLLDFKTSKGIFVDHLYQLGAYWNLLVEAGHPVAEARILRVGRAANEGFEERVVPADKLPAYFSVFAAALTLKNSIRVVDPK